MTDYIARSAAVCIADYAADEHPYDKDPEKPETFSEYNQGWHDTCDYIREKLEDAQDVIVAGIDYTSTAEPTATWYEKRRKP